MRRSLVPYNSNDPFREMYRMLDTMRDFARIGPMAGWTMQPEDTQLAINVREDGKNILVETAIPGVAAEDIRIDVTGDILTISAETRREQEANEEGWHVRELRYGKVARSVQLPVAVDAGKAEAEIENGILSVRLPKSSPNPVQKIAVRARNLLEGGAKKK
ncbi:MAG: Hsp20/alpha crystallin family protein [Anaerolineae bacterium]|nr:Hsp20/alpha crystallin family protein [Anaerolineae bacterium]